MFQHRLKWLIIYWLVVVVVIGFKANTYWLAVIVVCIRATDTHFVFNKTLY